MPVLNPDPTHREKEIVVGTFGVVILMVDSWELVNEETIVATNLVVDQPGTYHVRVGLHAASSEKRLWVALKETVSANVTLEAGANLPISSLYAESLRSIDGADVRVVGSVTVERQEVDLTWTEVAFGIDYITVPAQTTKVADFKLLSQCQVIDGENTPMPLNPSLHKKFIDHFVEADLKVLRFSYNFFFGQHLIWEWYEPAATRVDEIIAYARSVGLEVMLIAGGGEPCWASNWASKNCGTYDSRYQAAVQSTVVDPAGLAGYVTAMCDRWDIQYIETANEPNNNDATIEAAQRHADTCAAVRAGVDASSRPNIQVVGAVMAFADTEFLQWLYDYGMGPNVDAISVHPYNFSILPDADPKIFKQYAPWTILHEHAHGGGILTGPIEEHALAQGCHRFHKVMRANGDGDKPLMVTEWGYTRAPESFIRGIDDATKARYMAYGIRQMAHIPYVSVPGIYSLIDPAGDVSGQGFGSVKRDGTRLPSFYAIKKAIEEVT